MSGYEYFLKNYKSNKGDVLAYSTILSIFLYYVYNLQFDVYYLVNLTPDDALFYPRIAQNYLLGYGVSFDRLTPTTGFHMGWYVLLTAFLKSVSLFNSEMLYNPNLIFKYSLLLDLILLTLINILLYFLFDRCFKLSKPISIIGVIFIGIESFRYGLLMETRLLLLSLLCLFLYINVHWNNSKNIAPSGRPKWISSLLGAHCLLGIFVGFFITIVRIDFAILIIIIILFKVFLPLLDNSERFSFGTFISNIYKSVPLLIGMFLGILIVSCFNYYIAGSIISTSACIKSFNVQCSFNMSKWLRYFNIMHYSIFLFSIISTILLLFERRTMGSGKSIEVQHLIMIIIASGSLLSFHLLINNLVAPWYYRPFTFFMYILFFVSLNAWFLKWFTTLKYPKLVRFVALSIILCIGITTVQTTVHCVYCSPHGGHSAVYEFAIMLNKNTNESSTIFLEDYSGIISFFSQRNIINGDGLVNSPHYMSHYLSKGNVYEFLRNNNIDYYVISRTPYTAYRENIQKKNFNDTVKPFFLDVPSSRIPLSYDNRIFEYYNENYNKFFALYKLDWR